MKIAKNAVVAIAYTLKNSDGEVLDQSDKDAPLHYLHGAKNIIVGLEEALEGKDVGEELSVDVPSDLAYGPRVEALEQQVPISAFGEIKNVEVGMRFQAETEQGPVMVVVTQIDGEMITVDGNHPLAGQDLHFDVKIESIREASDEEVEHGHVHAEGERQH